METRILSDVALFGALVMSKGETDFPANPALGTIIIKNECIYAYIKIGGLETWYPFASKTDSYIHVQGIASTTWTINHNLGTTDIWYQLKDSDGNLIIAAKTDINENSFQVNLTSAAAGTCIVVAPQSIDVPEVKASLINIGSNAVLIDSSGVRINGSYALTSANIEQQIADAIATKDNSDEIAEGTTHLYFTNTRARAAVSVTDTGGDGSLSYDNTTGVFTYTGPSASEVRSHFSGGTGVTITDGSIAVDSTIATVSALNAEITRSTSAESTLSSNLNSEITRATNAESTLTSNLNSEITRATNAELTLTSNLNSEITRSTNAEATITSNLNSEITRATNAEATITSNLNSEITRSTNTDITLSSNILVEKTRALAAESTLQSAIDTEKTRAMAAESSIASSISSLTGVFQYIGTVSGGTQGSPTDLTSLQSKQAGDYYKVSSSGWFYDGSTQFYANVNDGLVWNLSNVIDKIDNTNTVISGTSSYVSVTGSTDSGYTVDLDSGFKTRVSTVESGLNSEITRATNAESTLSANILVEKTRAMAAESTLTTSVNSKEPTITAGTTSQYWRGDKTWQTLDKAAVGLSNVENTALSTWSGSSNLTTAGSLTAASLTVTGNLTVNGSTTTINSTTVTLDDPIITLGGDTAPVADDNKDRGVEFRWHNGSVAKVGFFGFDDSTGYLTFIPDATNTSEVFSGTAGDIQATNFRGALVGNADTSTKSTNLIGGNNSTLLGSIPYQSNTDTTTLLSPNTTTTKKFLRQTGTGTNGAAPAWDTLVNGDVPSALTGKTYNGLSLTSNATGFSVAGGTTSKTLTVNNSITLAGTDGTTITLPSTSGTVPLNNQTFYIGSTAIAINQGTGTLTLPNTALTNSSITINGSSVSLGGSVTVGGSTTNALTIGTGLSGTSFNGSTAVTIAIDSTVATLSGTQTFTNKTLTDSSTYFQDETDNTKKLQFQLSGITTANTRTLTIPDASGTIAITGNKLSVFAATTSAELAGIISDETGSGALVFGTSPAITTSLTTPSASFALINTTATTVNFAGAATTLSIGAGTGTTTVNNNLTVTGNLTINGTTTTVNSTTMTVDDPIITLGGDTAPVADDNKDRGVEFRWHNGSVAKVGFFGFDDSTGYLTFIPDATNTSEVFSGTAGDIQATNFRGALVGNADTATKTTNLIGGNSTTLLGSIPYQSNTDTTTLLSPNTTTTKMFLRQTGTGANGAAPAWDTLVNGDIPAALSGKTYNGLTLTANATGFSIAGGTTSKTLTVNNSITLAGTDGTTITLPSTSGTVPLNNQTFYIGTTAIAINQGTGTLTLPNTALTNSSITINGSSVSLGGSVTVGGSTTNALTIGTGLSGTSFNGSSPVTIAIDSTVATLTGTQTFTNKTLTDSTTYFQDETDNTKKLQFQLSGITTATTRTLTIPDASGTIAITGNKLSVFAATTSAELAGVISDETGSGALVFGTSPDITTSLTTGSASFNLINANATTVNFAGAATALSIGAGTGTTTVNNNLSVTGNLTINGTTTTVNSTTMTVDDPIITLGGDTAPVADDNKDRGVEFRWHNGSTAKVGFFGYDDSAGKFTFIQDATNTSEVFSGTSGDVVFRTLESNVATGTAPFIVASTTAVTNLNADMVDGKHVGTSGNTIPLLDGTNTWSSTQTLSSGTLTLSNATSNIINWGTNGVGAPTFTTRSAGTKLVIRDNLGASSTDYALGIDTNVLWGSVPTTAQSFKWYGGTTVAATLTGAGKLTTTGAIYPTQVSGNVSTLGSELITNGTFTGDASSWTLGQNWVYGTNNVIVTLDGNTEGVLLQSGITVPAGYYQISWTQTHSVANNGNIRWVGLNNTGIWTRYGDTAAHTVTHTIYCNWGATYNLQLEVQDLLSSGTITIDNISVKPVSYVDSQIVLMQQNGYAGVIKTGQSNAQNIAIGGEAWGATCGGLVYGSANTTLGYCASSWLTSGSYNTNIGEGAGTCGSSVSYNTIIGAEAAYYNIADRNTFVGFRAGRFNVTGASNVYVGSETGYNTVSGNYNTAVGSLAARDNSEGYENSYFGYYAGIVNTVGYRNVAVGSQAGAFTTSGANATSLTNSICIGYDSRVSAATDTNEIVIGSGARGNGSNTVTIGNSSITNTYLKGTVSVDALTLTGDIGLNSIGNVTSGTLTTSATTPNQVLKTISTSVYKTIKYMVQCTSGTSVHSAEVMMIYDGTSIFASEFSTIQSGASLFTWDIDISGGNYRLLVTPTNAVSVFKCIATMV